MLIHFDKRLPLQQLRGLALGLAKESKDAPNFNQVCSSSEMPRISEICGALNVHCLARPFLSEQAWPSIEIALDGWVELDCVRCTEPMRLPIQSRLVWCIAKDQDEMDEWSKRNAEADILIVSERVSLQELVEDEVLLCIPMMPRCDETLNKGLSQGCANKSLSELMS